jgi:3-deoxy-D-arabino-heptulosonate 7-phosphate (DAHP) synthase
MKDFTIIAGPCSIDQDNVKEATEIGRIPEVDGVRCVGLKSVTSPRPFMGIDKEAYFNNDLMTWPSVRLAQQIIAETGKFIAFELMDTSQLRQYVRLPLGKVFVWNPAIGQVGYPVYQSAKIGKHYEWRIGIKNPKWAGTPEFEAAPGIVLDNGEKNWLGNAKFSEEAGLRPVMIQRGIEGTDKGTYRNIPNHQASLKMKALGYEVFFDPSHTFGKDMRDEIVARTLDVLRILAPDGDGYLYSGILIEVGTSQTDTGQHITIDELRKLIEGIKLLRNL